MKQGWMAVCCALALALGLVGLVQGQDLTPLEGFGATTPGGSGGTVIKVTSLADSGPGTLREALARGDNLTVVFEVGGTIALQSPLEIRGQAFITIDGASAPSPGITLSGQGLVVIESHDIIVQYIRVHDSAEDGISIRRGTSYVVIDHCSTTNATDENMAITADATDVTVSWSILGDTRDTSFDLRTKGMLIAAFNGGVVTRVSVHHNLFINEYQRSPDVSTPGVVDVRNNVIMNWRVYGVEMTNGAMGNIVNNVFATDYKPYRAVFLKDDAGPTYIAGNLGPGTTDVNALSTTATAFEVAPVTTHAAAEVEEVVLDGGGAFPRSAVDAALTQLQ
jgi:pectate lyase